MKKRKNLRKQQAADDDASWLVSYADMMTLICCFFILMMALANYDPVGFNKKVKVISKHFNKDKYKSSEIELSKMTEEIARHPKIEKLTKITQENGELKISFSGTTLFKNEGYELTPDMLPALDALIDLIKTRDDSFKILVEGHTSNVPPKNSGNKSLWHLSSMRASSIAERFEYFGFKAENIVALGKGSTKPVLANQDKFGENIKENIVLNNRVVIKVLEPVKVDSKGKLRLGLGVYFKE